MLLILALVGLAAAQYNLTDAFGARRSLTVAQRPSVSLFFSPVAFRNSAFCELPP